MEIFLQNRVQRNPLKEFLRIILFQIKQHFIEKNPKDPNPTKILHNSSESQGKIQKGKIGVLQKSYVIPTIWGGPESTNR